jgi:hypothetical protein
MTSQELNTEIIDRLVLLQQSIDKLESRIINLENNVVSTNRRLTNHISFIDSVFNAIKSPLFYIMNKINMFALLNDKEDS